MDPNGFYAAYCRKVGDGFELVLVVNGFTSRKEADEWLIDMMSPYHDDTMLPGPTDSVH